MYKKKMCCTCKVAVLLIRPMAVFSPFSRVAFVAFIFCLNKLYIVSRASPLALAKSKYYRVMCIAFSIVL